MKKSFFLLIFLIGSYAFSQSVTVFRGYEEYLNKQGIKYDVFKKIRHTATGKYRILARKSGKNHRIKCERIWGFMLENTLFRSYGSGQYVMQVDGDKLFYFENGEAYLNKGTFLVGHYNFIAESLNGNLIPLPTPDAKPAILEQYEDFKQMHPKYAPFYHCFDKNHTLENCRDCIDRYNHPDKIRPFQ